MEIGQFCCGKSIRADGLPIILSTNKNNNPWMVTQNRNDNGIVNVYTIDDQQPCSYPCLIPELQHLGRIRIQGFFDGWMILSNARQIMWSLWNPFTYKLIRLPPLPSQDASDFITYGCLSSPPGDPSSILLLTRFEKPNFVFCRLVSQRKKSRSRWTEMSYAKQLQRIRGGGEKDAMLHCLTCCNGKVYALSDDTNYVVQIDIKVVKDKQVVISISPFLKYPEACFHRSTDFDVLKGSGTELFAITGRLDAPAGVVLFKLDMTTAHDDDDTAWEEINDLKDAVFFVDMYNIASVSYIPAVASGLGGYIHVHDIDSRMIIYSFHVKDKTLLQLPIPCLVKAIQVSMWEYSRGLEAGNDRPIKCTNDEKQQEEDKENDDPLVVNIEESRLLDVPFHVLEMIVEHCVGIEYMNMRATCKRCHLAAPPIQWRNKTSSRKLQKYSLSSPWLMVVEANTGIMNFTDPISGDKYFMKLRLPAVLSLIKYDEHNSKSCSKYGWLLFYARSSNLGYHQLVFFNPFTNDVGKLPPTPPHCMENVCFSAPPTSNDCVVVGFSTLGPAAYILRYHVDQQEEQLLWRRFDVDYGGGGCAPYAFNFPTFHGRDLYALCNEGQLVVFKDMREGSFNQPEVVAVEPPKCHVLYLPQYFLMELDQYLLLMIVDNFGGDPQLFQFNDSTEEWNQIQSLDKHVIFIGDATCVCFEAKTTPKMQNKIYFPRLKYGKLIFYSLQTSKYHTFDGRLATREEAFGCRSFRTHLSLHAWIEPTWY